MLTRVSNSIDMGENRNGSEGMAKMPLVWPIWTVSFSSLSGCEFRAVGRVHPDRMELAEETGEAKKKVRVV